MVRFDSLLLVLFYVAHGAGPTRLPYENEIRSGAMGLMRFSEAAENSTPPMMGQKEGHKQAPFAMC